MSKATIDQVCAVLNHKRVEESWVLRAIIGPDGAPAIERIARVAIVYPADGAGRLRLAVTDWSQTNGGQNEPAHSIGSASGYGYDKRTAALAGAVVGGVELGDHCDSKGRPLLRDLAHANGWTVIGSAC